MQLNSKRIFLASFISLAIHGSLFLLFQLVPSFSFAQKEKVINVLIPGERVATYISLGGSAPSTLVNPAPVALDSRPKSSKSLLQSQTKRASAPHKKQNSDLKIKTSSPPPPEEKPQVPPIAPNPSEISQNQDNAAQRQAGSGGNGFGIGNGEGLGSGESTGNTTQKIQDEMQKYIVKIVRILDAKKYYPRLSKENGEQGTIRVKLVLGSSGELLDYEFVKKSDFERLNVATLETLKVAAPFPPLPASYTQNRLVVEVPVSFRMVRN